MNCQKVLHIVTSGDERYMPGAIVALSGIALSAKPETALHFHVFTENVTAGTFDFLSATIRQIHVKSVVEQHVCDESVLAGLPKWGGSRMSAVRIYFPRLLPKVDWALYVDCDIVYLASVEEHFRSADDAVYVCVSKEMSKSAPSEERAWAKEHRLDFDEEHYFDAGVALFNLKKMRADGMTEMLLEFFNAHPDVRYADQTAMNYCFGVAGKKIIDQKYNWLQIYLNDSALARHPVIHYVSGVPWLPKISVVANGRFKLWHAFADKYVWQKKGESLRRSMPRWMFFVKRLEYYLLKTPVLCRLFLIVLRVVGRGGHWNGWKKVMMDFDISSKAIKMLFNEISSVQS